MALDHTLGELQSVLQESDDEKYFQVESLFDLEDDLLHDEVAELEGNLALLLEFLEEDVDEQVQLVVIIEEEVTALQGNSHLLHWAFFLVLEEAVEHQGERCLLEEEVKHSEAVFSDGLQNEERLFKGKLSLRPSNHDLKGVHEGAHILFLALEVKGL